MIRVLFVDDEERVLSGIENALLFDGDDVEATFAVSGDVAIAELAAAPFDVLVTDMKMPGLTGADVLEHARGHHPSVARIVLSGEVDAALAQRAMPLTHEFVSKPCDPVDLFDIVRKVHSAARSLDSPIIAELVGSMLGLPVQPRVYSEIQRCIDDGEGIASVASVVESDIAITTAVLRVANSAFFGFRTPATSVRDAVSRLGTNTVAGLALKAELAIDAPPAVIAELETLNSLAAGVARVVRQMLGDEYPMATLAALLRSIGVVVLQTNMTEAYRPIQEHFNRTGEADLAAELRLFGATHPEIGAYVLRMWKVDPVVIESVQFHRSVERATNERAIKIIHAMAAADAAIGSDRDVPSWIDGDLVAQAKHLLEEQNR